MCVGARNNFFRFIQVAIRGDDNDKLNIGFIGTAGQSAKHPCPLPINVERQAIALAAIK